MDPCGYDGSLLYSFRALRQWFRGPMLGTLVCNGYAASKSRFIILL